MAAAVPDLAVKPLIVGFTQATDITLLGDAASVSKLTGDAAATKTASGNDTGKLLKLLSKDTGPHCMIRPLGKRSHPLGESKAGPPIAINW